MATDLKSFCERVHGTAEILSELTSLPTGGPCRPPELEKDLRSIISRSRNPEIRALVLGPLKAGKSTLMNVLMRNPLVSQISQLPAYPCYVEVRDLERDENGKLCSKPEMVLYDTAGRRESLPPNLGVVRLNELLDEFITSGEEAEIRYPRVEQRTDLRTHNDRPETSVPLVLIDSPGLFFKRRVDDLCFGDGGYSEVTGDLYEACDAAIFVIRPEQLFFHAVAEYLSGFGKRAKMRIFIIVNASRRSRTQVGEEITDYDQVANAAQIQKYFLNHVADQELLAAVVKDDRVSLRFVDLLEEADTTFRGSPLTSNDGRSPLQTIRDYLFGPDLANKKIHDLYKLLMATGQRASSYIQSVRAAIGATLQECEGRVAELLQYETECRQELLEEQRRAEQLEREVAATGTRADTELTECEDAFVRQNSERLVPVLPEAEGRSLVASIYNKWVEKHCGDRTLTHLADRVWKDSTGQGRPTLQKLHKDAARQSCEQYLAHVMRTFNSPDYQTAARELGAGDIPAYSVDLFDADRIPPLLTFEPTRLPWHLLSMTPKKLWGTNGRRVIEADNEVELLRDQATGFVGSIWGPPWCVSQRFEPERLAQVAVERCRQRLLVARIDSLRRRADASRQRITELEGRLSQLAAEREHGSKAIDKHRDQIADLESRDLRILNAVNSCRDLLSDGAAEQA